MTTIDTITLIIAVSAFLLSLGSWIHALVTQRVALTMRIMGYYSVMEETVFFMEIENNSRLSIAVTQIIINPKSENAKSCNLLSKPLFSYKNDQMAEANIMYSLAPPINIMPLGAVSGFIVFKEKKSFLLADAKQVNFLIYTNRGKKIDMSLELPPSELDHRKIPLFEV